MATAVAPRRQRQTQPIRGWAALLRAYAAAQRMKRKKLAAAAQVLEDLTSLIPAVEDAQEHRGPFDGHVLAGWQLVHDLEAQRVRLLAEAHALEEVGIWTAR